MKKSIKKLLALGLCTCLAMGALSGCGKNTNQKTTENDAAKTEETTKETETPAEGKSTEVVTIKYPTYRVGAHLSAEAEKIIIDGFNKEYEGKIKVEIEELPSDQAYAEKMKVLAASNDLPDVVEGKDGVLELAIKNGQAIDLNDYINQDETFKKEIGENAIAANTRDGKLYSISNGNQLIGYFYNKELFAKAEITPAKTWDEFMDNCQKLKDADITPISMMTGENCWTTNLLLGAMVGTDGDTGNSFMKTKYPESYETPEMVKALERIQVILEKYSTQDALGAGYAVAANHFLQGNTAMVANGPWMTGDFSDTEKAMEGLADKIGVALFPNDGVFAQYEIGYMICSSDKAKQDAAFEFIKYKTGKESQLIMLEKSGTVPLTSEVVISDEYKAANPLIAELIEIGGKAAIQFNTIDNISYSGVIEEMSRNYPALAMKDITADDMAKAMTEAAAKNK